MATIYMTTGQVRGRCAHAHRTLRGAWECIERDARGCATQGGYSDRYVVAVQNGESRSLCATERTVIDQLIDENSPQGKTSA